MSRKRLEKLFEYESKQGAAIWAEDLMLLDAYDLNHDAGTCISLRPSDDSHRNTMGSERHNDVGLHDFASDEKKKEKQGMKLAEFPTRHGTLYPSEHLMNYRHALFNDCSVPKYEHRTPLS